MMPFRDEMSLKNKSISFQAVIQVHQNQKGPPCLDFCRSRDPKRKFLQTR